MYMYMYNVKSVKVQYHLFEWQSHWYLPSVVKLSLCIIGIKKWCLIGQDWYQGTPTLQWLLVCCVNLSWIVCVCLFNDACYIPARDCINVQLQTNHKKRPSCSKVLSHPWLMQVLHISTCVLHMCTPAVVSLNTPWHIHRICSTHCQWHPGMNLTSIGPLLISLCLKYIL